MITSIDDGRKGQWLAHGKFCVKVKSAGNRACSLLRVPLGHGHDSTRAAHAWAPRRLVIFVDHPAPSPPARFLPYSHHPNH